MPQNITDGSAFTSPIVAPADGDAGNAASVLTGLQGLADRTAYLNNIVGPAGTGVTNIRGGTYSTMTSLTGMASGAEFLAAGYGLYSYVNPSALSADGLLVVTSAVAGGQWLHAQYLAANANPGFATIGTAGASANRILASVVPYNIRPVSVAAQPTSNFVMTAGAALADVPGMSLTVVSLVEDLLFIDLAAQFANATLNVQCQSRIIVTDGGVDVNVADCFSGPQINGTLHSSVRYRVGNSGTVVIRMQAKPDATNTTTIQAQVGGVAVSNMRVFVVRP